MHNEHVTITENVRFIPQRIYNCFLNCKFDVFEYDNNEKLVYSKNIEAVFRGCHLEKCTIKGTDELLNEQKEL